VPERSRVTVKVFDLLGREVRELADAIEEAGYHTVEWDGNNGNQVPVASGVYFCRLTPAGSAPTQIRKMILLR
jgi:flagellar hook assembly protein FlgD